MNSNLDISEMFAIWSHYFPHLHFSAEKPALLWGRVIHRLGGLTMGPRTGESKSENKWKTKPTQFED